MGGSTESVFGRWSGLGPAQVGTCEVGSRPVPGGGSRLSLEKARTQRVAGGGPPPPLFFRARSFPLARFGGCAASFRSIGYYEPHIRALIWKLSFSKMLFSIFFPENASQIGLRISEEIAPLPYQRQRSPKRASGSKRAIKLGVQGAPPPALFLPISREKWGPPPGRRGPRGAAPRGGFGGTPPEGTQHRAAPGRWSGFGLAQVGTCEVGSRPVPGGDPGFL